MEQESIFVGIDVAKAQVDVAVRPTDDRCEVSHDDAGIGQLVSQLKILEPANGASGGVGRPGTAPCGSSGDRGVAGGGRQPKTGARLRQGHW